MQVILKEDYPSLGFVGDIVNVKPGFARNFLLPKKIALLASESSIGLFEHQKKILEIKKMERKKDADKFKDKIEGVRIEMDHASDGERLFGSVTILDIQNKLKEQGLEVDRKLIKLEAPIRTTGEHGVEIKLHQEVIAKLLVNVKGTVAAKKSETKKEPKRPKRDSKTKKADADQETATDSVEATEEKE